MQPPTLTAPDTNFTGNYDVSFDAPDDVSTNYEYRLYESSNSGFDWEYIGYISKASGGQPPFHTVERNKVVGEYWYKANICVNNAGATACTGYSNIIIVTISATETNKHVKRIGSLIASHPDYPGTNYFAFVEFTEPLTNECNENRIYFPFDSDFGEAALTEIKAVKALGMAHSYVSYKVLSDDFCELTGVRME